MSKCVVYLVTRTKEELINKFYNVLLTTASKFTEGSCRECFEIALKQVEWENKEEGRTFKCFFCDKYFKYEDMFEIWDNGKEEIGMCDVCHEKRLTIKEG